jgi:hypothetical protein
MIFVHFLIALSTVSAYITRCRYINSTTCFSNLNPCLKIDLIANTTIYAKFNELQEFRPKEFSARTFYPHPHAHTFIFSLGRNSDLPFLLLIFLFVQTHTAPTIVPADSNSNQSKILVFFKTIPYFHESIPMGMQPYPWRETDIDCINHE